MAPKRPTIVLLTGISRTRLSARGYRRQARLLQREPVDVAVHGVPRVEGQLDREPSFAEQSGTVYHTYTVMAPDPFSATGKLAPVMKVLVDPGAIEVGLPNPARQDVGPVEVHGHRRLRRRREHGRHRAARCNREQPASAHRPANERDAPEFPGAALEMNTEPPALVRSSSGIDLGIERCSLAASPRCRLPGR
jgi:hypothetical protein